MVSGRFQERVGEAQGFHSVIAVGGVETWEEGML